MSKHTPGPWLEVSVASSRYIVTDECNICEMFSPRTREERDANQRLIAAAPDLLEALQGIMAGVAGCQKNSEYEAARAAIAKATGEDEA